MLEFDLVHCHYADARRTLRKVPGDNDNVSVAAIRRDLPNAIGRVIAERGNSGEYEVAGSVGEYVNEESR